MSIVKYEYLKNENMFLKPKKSYLNTNLKLFL